MRRLFCSFGSVVFQDAVNFWSFTASLQLDGGGDKALEGGGGAGA